MFTFNSCFLPNPGSSKQIICFDFCKQNSVLPIPCLYLSSYQLFSLFIPSLILADTKAVLQQSFSTCVFRMQLHFQVCWKLTSVATVFCFLQFRLNHSILLKYTDIDINASSKLKTNDILAQNAAFWVFNRNFSISWKLNVLRFQTLKSHIFAVNAWVKQQSQRALTYSCSFTTHQGCQVPKNWKGQIWP